MSDVYAARGILFRRTDRLEESLSDFDDAIELTPEKSAAYWSKGKTWLEIGDIGLAIRDFTTAIELGDGISFYYLDRGKSWLVAGNSDNAISDFNAFLVLAERSLMNENVDHWTTEIVRDLILADVNPEDVLPFMGRLTKEERESGYNLLIEAQLRALQGDQAHALSLFAAAIPELNERQIIRVENELLRLGFGNMTSDGVWSQSDQVRLEECLKSGCVIEIVN